MTDKISIRIPSEIKNIKSVSSEILKGLRPYRISDGAAFDIRLCVEEAVRNAIVHGNKSKKDLDVTISYSIHPDRIEIEVSDQGVGFDQRKIPDPTSEENILKNSGRGVLIIKKLMDRVDYKGRGNIVRMVKFLK